MGGSGRFQFWLLATGLAGAALYSFYLGFRSWSRNRVVGDTPTSRVRSAAQGYVELAGRGAIPADKEYRAPLTRRPCIWWRYKIESRDGNSWNTVDSGVSETPFILDDDTGQCLIDPRGAEVYPHARDRWFGSTDWPDVRIPSGGGGLWFLLDALPSGKYRYTEFRLEPRAHLYAIGAFRTPGGVSAQSPERAMAELLREWKQDQPGLLARFDVDHDGVISAAEWDHARAAAREQVLTGLSAESAPPGMSVLSEPGDGRPFLLAASDEGALKRRLRLRAAGAMLVFVASCAALSWLLSRL